MNLLLSEEETLVRHGAHTFFGERMPVKALRALRDAHSAEGFDRAAWAEMAALGWAGFLIPEAYGGSGFGYRGLGQVLEEAGRTLAATPLLSTAAIAAPLLLATASEAQKRALLPPIAAGEKLVALALDESPRHAPHLIRTRAERRGAGYVLSGAKRMVLDGHVAQHYIVVARTASAEDAEDGISLFLVDAATPGLRCTRTAMVDSRNAANLAFDAVELGADALLGTAGAAAVPLRACLDGACAALAAEMLGSGLEAFERTVEYLKLRRQFGVAIGSFQALKHRAAQMFCELELVKSAVLAALDALDQSSAEAAALASLAKAKACDMLELVSCEAVQMHGGIGMTDAEEIGFFLKRARVAQQLFGDAGYHRDRYARLQRF